MLAELVLAILCASIVAALAAARETWRAVREHRLAGRFRGQVRSVSPAGDELTLEVGDQIWRVLLHAAPVELRRRPACIRAGDRLALTGELTERAAERAYRTAARELTVEAVRVQHAAWRPELAAGLLGASLAVLVTAILLFDCGALLGARIDSPLHALAPCPAGSRRDAGASGPCMRVDCRRPDGSLQGLQLAACEGRFIWSCNYRDGRMDGRCVRLDPRTGVVTDEQRHGELLEGEYVVRRHGRVVERSQYRHGKRHGLCREWDADGTLHETHYVDDQPAGLYRELRGGALVAVGSYEDGRREGTWRQTDCKSPLPELKAVSCTLTFTRDVQRGPAEFTLDDGSRLTVEYQDDRADGPYELRDKTGKVIEEGRFKQGELVGELEARRARAARVCPRRRGIVPGAGFTIGAVEVLLGSANKRSLAAAVEESASDAASCFAHRLRDDPCLAGIVRVQFDVDGSGWVSDTRVVRATLDDAEVEACLVGVVARWSFSVPNTRFRGAVSFRYEVTGDDQVSPDQAHRTRLRPERLAR